MTERSNAPLFPDNSHVDNVREKLKRWGREWQGVFGILAAIITVVGGLYGAYSWFQGSLNIPNTIAPFVPDRKYDGSGYAGGIYLDLVPLAGPRSSENALARYSGSATLRPGHDSIAILLTINETGTYDTFPAYLHRGECVRGGRTTVSLGHATASSRDSIAVLSTHVSQSDLQVSGSYFLQVRLPEPDGFPILCGNLPDSIIIGNIPELPDT